MELNESNQSIEESVVEKPWWENGKILTIVGVIALILVVIVAIFWWVSGGEGVDEAIQEEESTELQEDGLITFGSPQDLPLKELEHKDTVNDFSWYVRVYDVGTISEGEYEGYILAYAQSYFQEYEASGYVLYVADEEGEPVAWSERYIFGSYGCNIMAYSKCDDLPIKQVLGLTSDTEKDLDILPKELSGTKSILVEKNDGTGSFEVINPSSAISSVEFDEDIATSTVGTTESGFQVIRSESNRAKGFLPRIEYYIMLPISKKLVTYTEPDFLNEDGLPKITWTLGDTDIARYRYGFSAYGWDDCYEGITFSELEDGLIETGVTENNDPLWEVDPEIYPSVYECLHEKTKRYVFDDITQTGTFEETVSYAEFIKSHPMFFWTHSSGDLIEFVRSDVVPAAEKAKPVIYLYPEETQTVSVMVDPIGGFTETIPEYGDGWIVDASPSGVIINSADGQKYPYLFWEGGKEGIVDTPHEGFVVGKEDVGSVLDEKLTQFGLNDTERTDFIEYWEPKLSQAPYYFITFISRSEIDRVAPLTIYPQPDTVIRVLMDYKPLMAPISIDRLDIEQVERDGFTVVEWGGILR